MDIRLYGSILLLALLLLPARSKDVTTCIPKRGSTPQTCHTFSLSCPAGSYIRFDTLQYHWSDCLNTFNCPGPGQCCKPQDMNYICHSDFSIVDTYIAYEICSGRGSCNGAASNVISDVQEPTECPSRGRNQPLSANPLSVSFEYECIEAAAMVNLCEGTSKIINTTGQGIHFMYNRGSLFPTTKQPTQCTCRVEFSKSRAPNPPPTLAYQDIRLHLEWSKVRVSHSSSKCSSVHLTVSTSSKLEDRHCTSLDPVSSFYTREPEPVDDDLTIKIDSLFNDGPDDEPEMIWLSLKASSPVTVTCGSQIVPQKQSNKGDEMIEDEDDTDMFTIIIPVICVTIAIACLITVFVVLSQNYHPLGAVDDPMPSASGNSASGHPQHLVGDSFDCCTERKRKTKATESLRSRSARSTVRTVGDYDIYETIDDLSRHGSRYSKTGGYSQGYTDAYSSVSVDNFVPRQKHKRSYDKTIPEDDYNRITLRTSHEIPHDPDYARLHSDTDSGVVDTFAILHTNSSEENEVDGIDKTANSMERSANNATEYEQTRGSANDEGETEAVIPPLKRKDSYEMPALNTKSDETVDPGYSKPFKLKREENKQNDAIGGGTEASEKRENDRKTIDIVSSTCIANTIGDGYEEVRPVSATENVSSARDNLNTQDHEKEIVIIDIPLPKRSRDDSDTDSD